ALGHKRTFAVQNGMSALAQKADIGRRIHGGIWLPTPNQSGYGRRVTEGVLAETPAVPETVSDDPARALFAPTPPPFAATAAWSGRRRWPRFPTDRRPIGERRRPKGAR
ncbi:MAG: hypothetical protein WB037_09950, partial [Pseudolabrys sp.]